jgi:hypothetical protein
MGRFEIRCLHCKLGDIYMGEMGNAYIIIVWKPECERTLLNKDDTGLS